MIEGHSLLVILAFTANLIISEGQLTQLDICNTTANLPQGQTSGYIVSPNRLTGEDNYAFNQSCEKTLNYTTGGSVVFRFDYFDVEYDGGGCSYDFFAINDDKYCGYLNSKTLCYSGNSSVDLHWKTDDIQTWTGFEIHFEVFDQNQCECLADEPVSGDRKPCKFPFVLDGIVHNQCSVAPSSTISPTGPYCATSVDASNNLVTYGICDESIIACERVCKTTSGQQCLFPWSVNDVQFSGCVPSHQDNTSRCAHVIARDISGHSESIVNYNEGTCDPSADCELVMACNVTTDLKSGQIIPTAEYAQYNTGSYLQDIQCFAEVHNDDYESFYVTLKHLSINCYDSLEFRDPSSALNALRFCGETRGTEFESFSFCWKNFANSSDFSMNIDFISGPAEKMGRDGYLIDFQATNDTDLCPAALDNDMACTADNGQEISSDYEIYSYNYPYPYPTNLSCRWNIMPHISDSFPVIQIQSIDLGVPWLEIHASVDDIDTLKFSDITNDSQTTLTPDGTTDGVNISFVLVDKSGFIEFNSAQFFNFHRSFHISVKYLDPEVHSEVFNGSVHCLSANRTALCHLPFCLEQCRNTAAVIAPQSSFNSSLSDYGTNGDYLAAVGLTGLLQTSFDNNLFDGQTSTCTSVGANAGYRIDFQNPVIVTAIILVPFNVLANTVIQSYGGVETASTMTSCGTIGETGPLNTSDYSGAPFSICSQGIYSNFVMIQANDAFDACEVAIIGYQKPPEITEADFGYAFYFVREDGSFRRYLEMTWPRLDMPTCPNTIKVQDFGDVLVSTSNGATTLQSYNSKAYIFEIGAMEANLLDTYNITLTRQFVDNATYFPVGSQFAGVIDSDPFSTYLSRGPFCWIGSCDGVTDEGCAQQFELVSNLSTDTTWIRFVEQTGACLVLRTYTNNSKPLVNPSMEYLSSTQVLDSTSGSEFNLTDVPAEWHADNGSYCYRSCVVGLYSSQSPGFDANNLVLGQNQCNYLTRLRCCESDWCYSPSDWLGMQPIENETCARIVFERGLDVLDPLGDCLAPIPLAFSQLDGDSGILTFLVSTGVTSYGYVELMLYNAHGSALRTTPDICYAPTPSGFTTGNEYNCTLHMLRPATQYFAKLRGYNPDRDNTASGGSNDGVTYWSHYFGFKSGDGLHLSCSLDQFNVEFFYDDIANSNPAFVDTPIQISSGETPFDDQTLIQTQWQGGLHFEVRDDDLFRGFPEAVTVQATGTEITHLFFDYAFQASRVIHGNPNTFDANLAQVFSLSNERVSEVNGTFVGGILAAIQFKKINVTGFETTSDCFGTGDCSGFTQTQENSDQFVVSFSGETNANNLISALTLRWTSISFASYTLNDVGCSLQQDPNWNEIEQFRFHYTVSPPSTCGSIQNVLASSSEITYSNSVGTGSGASSSSGDILQGVDVQASRTGTSGFNLVCSYDSQGQVSSSFTTFGESVQSMMSVNEVPFKLLFYWDNTFEKALDLENVVTLIVGERFYFAASLDGDATSVLGGMTVYAPTCYATKTPNADISAIGAQYYTLETNGCPTAFDNTFERIEFARQAFGSTIDPMSAEGFMWSDAANSIIYIHCVVQGCSSANTTLCEAPTAAECASTKRSRSRRALADTEVQSLLQPMLIHSQPVYLKSKTPVMTVRTEFSVLGVQSSQLVLSLAIGMLLLLVKITHSMYKKPRLGRHVEIAGKEI